LLGSEHLSELYGNKFLEVCSAGCGHLGAPGNGASFVRDFEVQRIPLQAPVSFGPGNAATATAQDVHLTGRSCSYCNAPLRDTLVGWNETLPRALLHRCITTASQADLSLVLGSKLRVSPVADLPSLAQGADSTLVIVQASTTAKDVACLEAGGILIRASPSVVLPKLDAELRRLQQESTLATTGTSATAAIIRKTSPSGTPAPGAVSATLATAHTARAMSLRSRPGATQLASSLVKRDMKRRANSVQAASASALSLFTQRRGAPPNRGFGSSGLGLGRLNMARAATAGASLLSMDSNGAARASSSSGFVPLSASLPPFPCLDDDEMEDQSERSSAMPPRAHSEERHMPLQCSLSRPSSITSQSGGRHSQLESGASLLAMLQSLPPVTPMCTPMPDSLATPNYFRSLSPPPDMPLQPFAMPGLPALPMMDEE
jgi:hypothetical protein